MKLAIVGIQGLPNNYCGLDILLDSDNRVRIKHIYGPENGWQFDV